MIHPGALQLAADLGGTLLQSEGGSLLLVERLRAHGLPQVLVLGRSAADLREPLAAMTQVQAAGLDLNLLALLPLPGCDLPPALALHRLRLGALVAALDAGLPWLEDKPMLARRLPGTAFHTEPVPLPKVPMGPLEKAELKAFLPDWEKGRRRRVFRRAAWRVVTEPVGFETELWPGQPLPEGAQWRVRPLELPVATPLTEVLRGALRGAMGTPVPFLPLPGDPSDLHALRNLTREATAFRGPVAAWVLAFQGLAALPSPPHFCARC
jgi:hypothetical protein